jgi:triacylglycerol lipase
MNTADRLLSRAFEINECILPRKDIIKNQYPFVFVHGLLGWGERDEIYTLVPYWGLAGAHILPFLRAEGAQCYAASVGPVSSAWDRACELYAQLTGATVDYGAAHSAEFDHARFGISYDKPLFDGWSAEKKINLIGHSFGGTTIRLFLDILANGRMEEVAAAKRSGTTVSPFFEGGRGDWVHSLSAVGTPHNGTTFFEANPNSASVISSLYLAFAKALGITKLKGVYDFQLDQFGIHKISGESLADAAVRVIGSGKFPKGDSAYCDLTVDSALAMNDKIALRDNVYYFSYPGSKTIISLTSYAHRPCLGMTPALKAFSADIGGYYDKKTAGGVYIGKDWAENDGLVNTVSSRYPTRSDGTCLTESGSPGFVLQGSMCCKNVQPGIWNVMSTVNRDHLALIGGLMNAGGLGTKMFYRQIADNIKETMPDKAREN